MAPLVCVASRSALSQRVDGAPYVGVAAVDREADYVSGLDSGEPAPVTCDRCYQPLSVGEHGHLLCPYEPRRAAHHVVSDELPNGPYLCETLGHEGVWVTSKSHLRREAEARGLECVGGRKPDSYFAKQRRMLDEKRRDLGLGKSDVVSL